MMSEGDKVTSGQHGQHKHVKESSKPKLGRHKDVQGGQQKQLHYNDMYNINDRRNAVDLGSLKQQQQRKHKKTSNTKHNISLSVKKLGNRSAIRTKSTKLKNSSDGLQAPRGKTREIIKNSLTKEQIDG